MDDERAPICPFCGVTMVPASLSAHDATDAEWICVECEETSDRDVTDAAYAAYDRVPLDSADEWGDLASFRSAAGAS